MDLQNDLKQYLSRIKGLVDGYIYAYVKGEPEEIYNAALHLIKAGGKRLRPLITIAFAEMLSQPPEKALSFASAVELVHNFTLVHDDIMDKDEFRRGVPTVHRIWGEAFAIIAGDLLFSKSFEVLVDALNKGIPPQRVVRAANVLSSATSTVAEGQALDMLFAEEEDVDVDDYLKMIYKKTGALFEAAAILGVLVATDDELLISSASSYGKNLGLAFQIRDDILGIIGDEKVTGKPVYSDIREGKKTLPIIYALSNLPREDSEYLRMILGKKDALKEELSKAANLVVKSGAIEFAEKKAKEFGERAIESLKIFPENNVRKILERIVEFTISRQK